MIDKNLVLPNGYGVGIARDDRGEKSVAHLYKLNEKSEFGKPMCEKGWTNKIYGYSIFKGHTSPKGICKKCFERAIKGLDGVDYKLKNFDKLSQNDQRLIISAMSSTAMYLYSNERYLENEKDEEIINVIKHHLQEAERLMYLINVLCGSESYQE